MSYLLGFVKYIIAKFRALVDLGFSVIPVPWGEKGAKLSWKEYAVTKPSVDEIATWDQGQFNVGVVTGRLSNICVLDVDSEEAQKFVDGLSLPITPTVKTWKGRHYYFRFPDVEIRSQIGLDGFKLDFKGEGVGYVIGPESLHPNGCLYSWEVSPADADFAEMPANLIALLTKGKAKQLTHRATTVDAPFVEAGLLSTYLNIEIQTALQNILQCTEGSRNDMLFKQTARIANHVAAIGFEWSEIAPLLESAGLAAGLGADECQSTVASAWKKGSQSPTKFLKVAADWIYVASRDEFWSPKTREFLKPAAFSRNFADAMPVIDGKPMKGRLADYLINEGIIERVLNFTFDPTKPSGVMERSGARFYNSYLSPNIVACEGDCSPFVEYLAYLVPDDKERGHLEKMIAWTVRNPGKKLGYALLLQSKRQGIGKTTLIDIWRALLGPKNSRKTNSEEMASNYQSYLADTLLVVLEELNLGSGMHVYNKLKDLITGETAIINEKFVRQREVQNLANFVFLSNLDAPILVEQNDRRFFVIDSPAQKRDADYWIRFHAWWQSSLGIVKRYFDSIDLSDFQPHAAPPMTDAKERLMRHSETPLVQELRSLIDQEQWPFTSDIVTLDQVRVVLGQKGFRKELPSKLTIALKDVGGVPLGQHRMGGEGKLSFWACRKADMWSEALPEELRNEYSRKPMIAEANDNGDSVLGEVA